MGQPLTAKLNAVVKGLEDLKSEFGEYKIKAQDTMKYLKLQNAELREKLEDTEDRFLWLAESVGLEEALEVENDRGAEEDCEDEEVDQKNEQGQLGEVDNTGTEHDAAAKAREKKSLQWMDSKEIKVSIEKCAHTTRRAHQINRM
jgi:hypothetical protein